METLKVNVKEMVTTREIEVPIPSFFRSEDGLEWTAILTTDQMIKFRRATNFTAIIEKSISGSVLVDEDLQKMVNEMQHCSEEMWMENYERVINSLSLKPALK